VVAARTRRILVRAESKAPLRAVEFRHLRRPTAGDAGRIAVQLVASFPEYKLAEYFAVRGDMFRDCDHVTVAVADDRQRTVGIIAARWREVRKAPFLHLEMNLVAHEWQRTPLFFRMWKLMLQELSLDDEYAFPEIVAIKTYNPMVYDIIERVTTWAGGRFYPQIDGAQETEMRVRASDVASVLCPGLFFEPDLGVIRGAGIPRDFYPSLPQTGRPRVQAYFEQTVRAGDRLLCVMQLQRAVAVPSLSRHFRIRSDDNERQSVDPRPPGTAVLADVV